ncbi:hypothetical protein amrb99_41250 [Actinomadura sp. RB99]|uniref:DUF6317 family protein n=1 Tax=Actinomadura sp. RB99 TaxID=2691577 RepID=UPI001683EE4A|nr:DUF6317 family protein [Actinomadura sp. RB99]MBD2895191.1 hypothetical protein [Actinomadura sp. RB99]
MTGGKGFSVFYPALMTTARTFAQSASTYESLMPDEGLPAPRSGSDLLDQAMKLTLRAMGGAHNIIADVVDQHAFKLADSHRSYSTAESDIIDAILNNVFTKPALRNPPGGQAAGTVMEIPELGKFKPRPLPASKAPLQSVPPVSSLRYWSYATGGSQGRPDGAIGDPWIGGDIAALSNLGVQLSTFSAQTQPITEDLIASVRHLLRGSGEWTGTGATNFARSFSWDAANMRILQEEVAEAFSTDVIGLAWDLYGWQGQLEMYAQPLVDAGCRVECDGVDFVVATDHKVNYRDALDTLNSAYHQIKKYAKEARDQVTHNVTDYYRIVYGILDSYRTDNSDVYHTTDLNSDQGKKLQGYVDDLDNLRKEARASGDAGLQLDFVSGGKWALQKVASTGPWSVVAQPIVEGILALLSGEGG